MLCIIKVTSDGHFEGVMWCTSLLHKVFSWLVVLDFAESDFGVSAMRVHCNSVQLRCRVESFTALVVSGMTLAMQRNDKDRAIIW